MNSAEAFISPQPARTSFHRTRSTSIGAATSTATTASVMQPQQQQQQQQQQHTTTTTTTTTYDDDLCVSIGNWEHDHDGDYYDASSDTTTTTSTTGFIPTKQALTLVRQVARRMAQGQREVEDDLVQEGVIALMQAINHYPLLLNEKGGESFERYAKRYIILEMTKSLETGSIKLAPTRRIQIANELQIQPRELERYERLQKHSVSVESTVETDDPDEVIQVFTDQDYYDKTHYYEVTDEEWMDEDDDEQVWLHPSTTSLKELIVDRDELTPEMDALQAMIRSDVHDVLQEILNDVELQVIRMHFGLMGEGQQALSWKDTAKRMKTTKQFVQSISVGAIQKLRTPSYASRYIETYLDGEYQHIEDSI